MKSQYRLGHHKRPDREWEVFNQNYDHGNRGMVYIQFETPWFAYHPNNECQSFKTHAQAIAYIDRMESNR